MRPHAQIIAGLPFWGVLLLAPAAPAQELNWDVRMSGEFELGSGFDRQETKNAQGTDDSTDRYGFEERLTLDAGGFVVRPDVLRFKAGGSFGLRQVQMGGSSVESGTSRGRISEYNLLVDSFSDLPVGLTLFGNRSETRQQISFGSDTEVTGESLGGSLRIRQRHFPSVLSYRRVKISSVNPDVDLAGARDEERHIIEFNGENAGVGRNIRLRLRHEDVSDKSLFSFGDYTLEEGSVTASSAWGDYMEHAFHGGAHAYRRRGGFDVDNLSSTADYSWDVTQNLNTSLRYSFDRFDSRGSESTIQAASVGLDHQWYESLESSLRFYADETSHSNGERSRWGAGYDSNYRKRIPWDGYLLANFNINRELRDNDLTEGGLPVVGEPVTISGFSDNLLEHPRVDPTSLLVSQADGRIFIEGIDYDLREVGLFTSLEIPFGSSILDGQALLVDYTHEEARNAEILKRGFGYGAGADFGWLLFYAEHEEFDEDLVSGEDDAILSDSSRDAFHVELRGQWPRVRTISDADFIRRRETTLSRDEWGVSQRVIWRLSRRWNMNAKLRYVEMDFTDTGRTTETLGGTLSLVWRPGADRSVRFFAEFQDSQDSDTDDRLQTTLGLRGDFSYGRLTASPWLRWNSRENGDSTVSQLRGEMRLIWRLF